MNIRYFSSRPRIPRRSARRSAFTLIEILLVVVIIGILAAVAIPSLDLKGNSDRARTATTKAKIASVMTQVQVYYMEKNKYPPTLQSLVSGKYLKVVPKDGWGNELQYDPKSGDVYANGPDGKITPDQEE